MQFKFPHKIHWYVGWALGLLFFLLLSLRLGFFQKNPEVPPEVKVAPGRPLARDAWLLISQKGRRIGYARRQLSPNSNGSRLTEEVFMNINMMGVVQPLGFRTEADLDSRLVL